MKTTFKTPLFLILGLLFGLTSCSKGDRPALDEGDYLIFGHYYGFCHGESCIETFKLTDTKLYEDSKDNYGGGDFDFHQLGEKKFEQAKDLMDYFPAQLLLEEEEVFGCPDCSDGGGMFIQVSRNGRVTKWRIDQMKRNVPQYLHEFMDKVNEKIQLINN